MNTTPPPSSPTEPGTSGYVPVDCPRCGATQGIDPRQSSGSQRCASCGSRMGSRQRRWSLFLGGQGSAAAPAGPMKERQWFLFAGGTLVAVLAAVFGLWMFRDRQPVVSTGEPVGGPLPAEMDAANAPVSCGGQTG
jgi:hypothetical protein